MKVGWVSESMVAALSDLRLALNVPPPLETEQGNLAVIDMLWDKVWLIAMVFFFIFFIFFMRTAEVLIYLLG